MRKSELKVLRSKLFKLTGDCHKLHLLVCQLLVNYDEELYNAIMLKIKEVRKSILNLS